MCVLLPKTFRAAAINNVVVKVYSYYFIVLVPVVFKCLLRVNWVAARWQSGAKLPWYIICTVEKDPGHGYEP